MEAFWEVCSLQWESFGNAREHCTLYSERQDHVLKTLWRDIWQGRCFFSRRLLGLACSSLRWSLRPAYLEASPALKLSLGLFQVSNGGITERTGRSRTQEDQIPVQRAEQGRKEEREQQRWRNLAESTFSTVPFLLSCFFLEMGSWRIMFA